MKKTIIALGIVTSVIVACTPKASKTPAPPPTPPTPEITKVVGSVESGSVIIASEKCTKCHKDKTAFVPKNTFAEQEKTMLNMAKKAKLSEQETADLMAYVQAKAKV